MEKCSNCIIVVVAEDLIEFPVSVPMVILVGELAESVGIVPAILPEMVSKGAQAFKPRGSVIRDGNSGPVEFLKIPEELLNSLLDIGI